MWWECDQLRGLPIHINYVCAICQIGYNIISNVCVVVNCPNSFVFDTFSKSCACPLGTFEGSSGNLTICMPCMAQCINCTASVCYLCVQGYYPIGSSCSACPPNCMTCSFNLYCKTCNSGFTLSSFGRCISLANGIRGVTGTDGTTVVMCSPGC